MNKKGVKWFYRELPQLVSKGILSAENAGSLLVYYGEHTGMTKREVAFIIKLT